MTSSSARSGIARASPSSHRRAGTPAAAGPCEQAEQPLLAGRGLVFRDGDRGEPILQGAEVQIAAGDRLLLEGPSGGGKSTLAMVLAGGRVPSSGLLLLGGLDPA